tara:strand:- start:989 stop:1339 length:351 start_codon:yes stop_codon:yes gene_type:complete
MGLFDRFKKKKEEPKPASKPKKVSPKDSKEPWVDVLEVKLDKDNPSNGYFELDWNNAFVIMLRDNGYEGSDDEIVVNTWFNDLCKTIVREDLEDEYSLLNEAPNIVQLEDGRKEIR